MRGLALLLVLLAAGCIAPEGGPGPVGGRGACVAEGPAPFVRLSEGGGIGYPGFVPDLAVLEHDGRLRVFVGQLEDDPAEGVREAREGALQGMTPQEVRAFLAEEGIRLDGKGVVVYRALARVVLESEQRHVCDVVLRHYYELEDRYDEDVRCTDGGGATWRVSTPRGLKEVVVLHCTEGEKAIAPVREAFTALFAPAPP